MDFSRKLIYSRFNDKMWCICKFLESEFDERVYTFEINQIYVIGHFNPIWHKEKFEVLARAIIWEYISCKNVVFISSNTNKMRGRACEASNVNMK